MMICPYCHEEFHEEEIHPEYGWELHYLYIRPRPVPASHNTKNVRDYLRSTLLVRSRCSEDDAVRFADGPVTCRLPKNWTVV